ncbi:MAG: beta-N-acetylhexosaminidase [Minwuia sp.]|uniref:beta-N-acetylhexosaminidase n=1 Tax=Minwuia sp. TaxID=2493630 RepID=UPI003A874DB3
MKPAIFGISGPELTGDEAALLAEHRPLGVILFRRNVETPDQVRRLTDSVRRVLDTEAPCLWVDQEGGRVQRLTEPHWEKLPRAAAIGALWERDPETAEYAAWLSGRIIADQCAGAGFDIACAPVLDLAFPGTHDVIGDRAFGASVETVATLGRSQAEGLLAGGIVPVSKHWPGHCRTLVDSHDSLPLVTADRTALEDTDFASFRAAGDCAPIAMTGHLVFRDIDPDRPSTLSPDIIEGIIRGFCGFDGFLVSDDLDMKALDGSRGELATAAVAAGCDGVLQCSGDFTVMTGVAEALSDMGEAAAARWAKVSEARTSAEPVDRAQLLEELRDVVG